MSGENSTGTEAVHRCLLPGCGRKLTSQESLARGYGPRCRAKIRKAAKTADLSPWTASQIEDARELIDDGGVVPTSRPGVFNVVSSDGTEVHLTHRDGCNCAAGLKTRPSRPCYHRCAVVIMLAAQAPAARPAAAAPAPVAASADLWAEIDRLSAAFAVA